MKLILTDKVVKAKVWFQIWSLWLHSFLIYDEYKAWKIAKDLLW